MFTSILVPIDLDMGEFARPALDMARALAQVTEARLTLLYVSSIQPITYLEFLPAGAEHEQRTHYMNHLRSIAHRLAIPEDRVDVSVRAGSIHHEVLDEAKQIKADLIVVGSHRPSMASYLLGSNAATIVRHAACSVLVVRGPGTPKAPLLG